MAFGENIEEIVLKVRAEGRGEADAMKQAIAALKAEVAGFFAKIAEGDDVVGFTRKIGAAANQIKVLESALVQIDPAYQKLIQTKRDVAAAFAESERAQAAAAKAAQDQQVADMATMRAKLAEYNDRDKAEAAEAAAMRKQSSREVITTLQQQAQELEAVSAKLGEYNDRDKANAAEAAALRKVSTREAVENLVQVQQAEKDILAQRRAEEATLHDALRAMNERDAAEAAESARMRTQASRSVVEGLHAQAEGNKLLATAAQEAADAENAAYQARLKQMAEQGGVDRATRERENADAVVAGTNAVRDQMQAYADMEAVRRRLGQMETTESAAEQERLREAATRRAEILQEEERLATKRRVNVEAYSHEIIKETQLETLRAHAVRELASEEASLNQVINVGASYTKGRNLDADRTNKYLEEQARLVRKGVSAGDEAAEANKRFGYSILHVSHAIQDMQYGFGALLNNIPLVVQAFGGGPGLAGGVMIAGVALDTLYRHADKAKGMIVDMSNVYETEIEKMAAKVETLNEAWLKNKHQIHEAAQATRDLAAMTEAAKVEAMPTEEESAYKKAFDDTVKKIPGGGRAVESTLQDLFVNQFNEDQVGSMRRAIEEGRIERNEATGVTPEKIAETMQDDRMYAILKEQWYEKVLPMMIAQAVAGLAKGDVPTFRGVMAQAGAHPRLGIRDGDQFENRLLRGMEENDPRTIKKQKQEEIRLEVEQRTNVAAYDARVKAAKKAQEDEEKRLAIEQKTNVAAYDASVKMRLHGPDVIRDPVTGKMLTDTDRADLKMMDDDIRQGIRDAEAAEKKAGKDAARAAARAQTPQGRQGFFRNRRLVQQQGIENQVAQGRPDLNQQQVVAVAGEANRLMAQGWNRNAAIVEALLRLQRQLMQTMQIQAARQEGFMGTIQELQAENRRMQQRRPSILPSFPRR